MFYISKKIDDNTYEVSSTRSTTRILSIDTIRLSVLNGEIISGVSQRGIVTSVFPTFEDFLERYLLRLRLSGGLSFNKRGDFTFVLDNCIIEKQRAGDSFIYELQGLSDTTVTSVIVPPVVNQLKEGAFARTGIEYVYMSKRVSSISNNCFFKCEKLKQVEGLKRVIYVCNKAFFGCKSLVLLPRLKYVVSIEDLAFHGCESLVKFTCSDSAIGKLIVAHDAFDKCKNLRVVDFFNVDGFNFEESMFFECDNLEEIRFPRNTLKLPVNFLRQSESLRRIVVHRDSLELIQRIKSLGISNGVEFYSK